MKIIDLINKIANGEEVPEKIIYKYNVYNFNCEGGDYYNNENDKCLLADLFERCPTQDFINNIVEILEEEKKIPEKLEEYIHTDSLNYNQCNYMFEKLTNKYNELIDYLDYLKSKGE